jgi:hypothetical protein
MRIFKLIYWFFKGIPAWFGVHVYYPFVWWLDRRTIRKHYQKIEAEKKTARSKYVKPIPSVKFEKPVWRIGTPNEQGKYIVRHKGKMREAIFRILNYGISGYDFKVGFIIDHRDMVPMKGVTAWYPAPVNLMQIN